MATQPPLIRTRPGYSCHYDMLMLQTVATMHLAAATQARHQADDDELTRTFARLHLVINRVQPTHHELRIIRPLLPPLVVSLN